MATLNAYLNFPGTTEEAFNFYKSVFVGEIVFLQRFKDTPEADKIPENEKGKIMHMALQVGKGSILMATDTLESLGQKLTIGNNIHIAVSTDSKEETEKFFHGLSAGGTVTMPLQNTFWGAYFGMVKDKFGIQWMLSYALPQQK
jgi:PhnB protein